MIGRLDYTTYPPLDEGKPPTVRVDWAHVAPEHQQQGHGRDMVRELHSRFPNHEITWGVTTNAGEHLRRAWNREQQGMAFNPDQPRDETGKWTSEGGDTGERSGLWHLAGNAGNAESLIRWYNEGADGQIDWGTDGDFEQCVSVAGEHVSDPEGFCAERHHDATGQWPGKGRSHAAEGDALAFNPDQPRDEHGRWAPEGGAEADKNGATPGTKTAGEAARELRAHAYAAEEATTASMQDAARLAGGKLEGLDLRLKGEDSLERKIADRMDERGLTADQAKDTISDSLRYTVATEPTTYTDGTQMAILSLKEQGWTPNGEPKNYWPPGDAYNGINSNWYTPTGDKVEVQFHTPESFAVKNSPESLNLYHEARDAQADGNFAHVRELEAQQSQLWAGVTSPPDVMSIGRPMRASSTS